MKHTIITLVAFAFPGCVPDVPETPSFQEDVLPILAANCVRCHGLPVLGGAPEEFRLDSFANTVVTDGLPGAGACGGDTDNPQAEVVICGASQYALLVGARLRNEQRPMPPRFPLEEYQLDTLARWVKAPVRGSPRPGNHPPTLVVNDITRLGTRVTVRTRVEDGDHDLVVGTVYVTVAGRDRVVGSVRSGTLDVTWDSTGVPPGAYPLSATLDDGADVHAIRLGVLDVEAP